MQIYYAHHFDTLDQGDTTAHIPHNSTASYLKESGKQRLYILCTPSWKDFHF